MKETFKFDFPGVSEKSTKDLFEASNSLLKCLSPLSMEVGLSALTVIFSQILMSVDSKTARESITNSHIEVTKHALKMVNEIKGES